ncbi:MAG: phosphoadenosine phosphosulfate reductase family protein [Saezia sp.]
MEQKNRTCVLSLSSGKDSTAMLLLAKEMEIPNMQVVFADTGNEHPMTYEYIQYLAHVTATRIRVVKADFTQDMKRKAHFIDTKWREQGISDALCNQAMECLKPTGNPFLDLCLMKGIFPSVKIRFCTDELKRNPMFEQVYMPLMDEGHSLDVWQGVRADESRNRAKLPVRDLVGITSEGVEHWNYRPILHWTVDQVFAMHKKHNIIPNPLYQLGMGRVGCMPCIMCKKDELLHIAMRFPEEIERIARWEALVSKTSKVSKSSFFSPHIGRGVGIWECVRWSKTRRGSNELDMDRIIDTGRRCSSHYGLCE